MNPRDPQAAWLIQSALSEDAHRDLKAHAEAQGARYFASVFDAASLRFISALCGRIKIASTEAHRPWWRSAQSCTVAVTWPWGEIVGPCSSLYDNVAIDGNLSTVPLYPTPIETIHKVKTTDGWSDHVVGLSACSYFIALGAKVIEVHVSLPTEGRQCPWDKTQDDLTRIRDWMQECQVMRTGVSRTFRERWVR